MKKFSIYKIISIVAFLALIFILALPNFFNINKRKETEECVKNMQKVYNAAEQYWLEEQKSFTGTSSDLERMDLLDKSYECPSEGPGDKYQVHIDSEGNISVRCLNEIKSSPYLAENSFEDFSYFLNIVKYHQKPASSFIYDHLDEETKELLEKHITYSDSKLNNRSWKDWEQFIEKVLERKNYSDDIVKEIWALFPGNIQEIFMNFNKIENPLTEEQKDEITAFFNDLIVAHEFSEEAIKSVSLPSEAKKILKKEGRTQIEKQRFNRIVLELIFPYQFQEGLKYNPPTDDLTEKLIDNLNNLIKADTFNNSSFYGELDLSGEAKKLLEKGGNSERETAILNRTLLRSAYPRLISKYEELYSDHVYNPEK